MGKFYGILAIAYVLIGNIAGWLLSAIAFVGIWLISVKKYGLLLGILFGWIPAGILAGIINLTAAFIWPVLIALLFWLIFRSPN